MITLCAAIASNVSSHVAEKQSILRVRDRYGAIFSNFNSRLGLIIRATRVRRTTFHLTERTPKSLGMSLPPKS